MKIAPTSPWRCSDERNMTLLIVSVVWVLFLIVVLYEVKNAPYKERLG